MKIEASSSKGRTNRDPGLLLWLGVLFLGSAALGAWFLIGPAVGPAAYFRPAPVRSTYSFSHQVLVLFIPYALALFAWRRGHRLPVKILLGGAVALHLLVLFAPPPQSQDFFQYLFYGRMQSAHGANPYIVNPSVFNWDPWYGWIRWRNQPSLYGPAWTLVSFGVTKVAGDSLALAYAGLKVVILALDLSIMTMIVRAARGSSDHQAKAGWGILAYAWNPLVLITVPLAGAADVGVAAAFLAALLARRRGRSGVATALLTFAALVKVYAVVGLLLHLVLVVRNRGRKTAFAHLAVSAAVAGVTYAPYWAGFRTFEGMLSLADLTNKSLVGAIQRLLQPVLTWLGFSAAPDVAGAIVRWVGTAILALAVTWAIRRVWVDGALWEPVLSVLAVYLLVTPWFVYWYVIAPLVLVAVLPQSVLSFPVLTLSGTAFVTARFPPWLLAQVIETGLKFGPPLLVYRRERKMARRQDAGLGDARTASDRPVPGAMVGSK